MNRIKFLIWKYKLPFRIFKLNMYNKYKRK